MSSLAFNIASGKQTQKQTGGMYSRTRVDMVGKGIGRDLIASVVGAVLPKALGALSEYGTKKIVSKIKGEGKRRCKGGSYKLR